MDTKFKTERRMRPPRWMDKFLEWYCRADLLEEIQGDAYELYYRRANKNKSLANVYFCWNVIRFFRWKNIRKTTPQFTNTSFTLAMLKNIITVAIRSFFRQPGHGLLNIFGLSIGLCCVMVIFLWVNHESSFDKFHHEADKIFKVITHVEADGSIQTVDAASAGIDVSTIPEIDNFVTISNGTRWPHELCFRPEQKPDECVYLNGVYASPSLFSVFSFPILEGDQDPLKENFNIAISEVMAEKLYGIDNAIGKTMKIDGHIPVTIAAVFRDVPGNSSIKFDFAMPFAVQMRLWGIRDEQFKANFFPTYIKVNDIASVETLTQKLNGDRVVTEDLKKYKISYQAFPFSQWHLNSKFENGKNVGGRIEYVRIFLIIGTLVLLLAIINYINLSTARAPMRSKEIGIRKVTGAFRNSIIAQFLGESFLMVVTAFLLALILTQLALPFFVQVIGEPLTTRWYVGSIPYYLVGLLVIVALAAGLYPAFVVSSFQPIKILKSQINAMGTGSDRMRKALLLIQLAVSLVIINFSGVMYYQLNFINKKNLGFEHANTIRIEPTINILNNFEVLKNELKKDPSITGVAASNLNPIGSSGHNIGVSWPGKSEDTRITFQTIGCSYEFPETIGLTILQGRNFDARPLDSLYTEVLVTEDAVKVMNLTNPVGEHIQMGEAKCVIIGVVNDFHTESLHQARLPVILHRVKLQHTAGVYVRYVPGATEQAIATIIAAYKNLEPSFTMKYWFQDETFNSLYKTEKTASRLVLIFTIISILIAVMGVIGLSTFNVMRRTKEISIRRVFGASSLQVIRLLSKEFGFVMLLALLLATPLAWYASQVWLAGFVYHAPLPWWLFPISFTGLAILTIGIIIIQGIKTIVSNPAKTLRIE